MKNRSVIIIIVLLLLLIGSFVVYRINSNKLSFVSEACFFKTVTDSSGTTSTSIKAKLYSDHSVTGSLDFLPSDKDKLTGPFSGTWQASATVTGLNIIHDYSAEGVNANAKRMIVFNDKFALIDWDGSGPIDVSNDQIPKVSCE